MVKILITSIKTVKIVKTVRTKTVKTIRSPCKYPDRELISPYMSQIDRRLLHELCEDTQDRFEKATLQDNCFWDNSHIWDENYTS